MLVPMLSRASIVSFVEIALIVAALLNLETVWQTVANYSFLELESYTSLLQVFGGLALGKVLGILFCREWSRTNKLFLTAGSICVAWLGFLFVPALSFVWLTVPFIGFGVLFVDLFSNEPLRRLIIVSGLVGALYFAVFPFVTGVVAEWLILLSLALLLACAALTAKLRVSLSGLGLLLIIGSLLHLGYLTVPSQFSRHVARFADAQPVAPPEVNLLFRTDLLYLPSIERYVLSMNGSRFMVLPTPAQMQRNLADPFAAPTPAYDTPYLFGKRFDNVLVIGPAGGKNVISAVAFGASSVTGVDINPAVFSFLRDQRPELLDGLYLDPRVRTVRMEGRHFLETTDEKFDLIVLQGVQTGTQVQHSSTALLESFLFTEEALETMWSRLNDGGAIFFDEYESRTYLRGVMANLGLLARDTLPLEDPERQIFEYTYLQNEANPQSDAARMKRAGLIIWRNPIEGDIGAAQEKVIAMGEGLRFRKSDPADVPTDVTDNKPVFVQELGFEKRTLLVIGAFMAALIGALYLMRRYGTREDDAMLRLLQIGLVALGAAYILCVMSFWGPIVLLTGEPFVVGPLVYFGLYFFGLIGGLLALRLRRFSVPMFFIAGLLGIVFAWWLLVAGKEAFLGSENAILRYGLGFAAISILALCFELPYITALKVVERTQRGELYAYGALGSLLGAGVSLIVQPAFGFSGSMIVGIALLLVAGYAFYRGRKVLA